MTILCDKLEKKLIVFGVKYVLWRHY